MRVLLGSPLDRFQWTTLIHWSHGRTLPFIFRSLHFFFYYFISSSFHQIASQLLRLLLKMWVLEGWFFSSVLVHRELLGHRGELTPWWESRRCRGGLIITNPITWNGTVRPTDFLSLPPSFCLSLLLFKFIRRMRSWGASGWMEIVHNATAASSYFAKPPAVFALLIWNTFSGITYILARK